MRDSRQFLAGIQENGRWQGPAKINEFGEFAFLLSLGQRAVNLAMIGAFIDDSGSHAGSSSLVLSAFCATTRTWKKVLREWGRALYRSGARAFHATDCANGAGEFLDWSNERKKALFKSLIDVLGHHSNLVGYSAAIRRKDYEEIVSEAADRYFGSATALVFRVLLGDIAKRSSSPVSFIVDRPTSGWEKLDQAFQETRGESRLPWAVRLHSLTPGNVREFPAMQTADLLAYETYRYLNQNVGSEPKRGIRKSMERLIVEKSLVERGSYLGKVFLREFVEQCRMDGAFD